MERPSRRNAMTDAECRRGWVLFALYLLVFPYVNAWVQRLLMGDAETLVAEANVVYYLVLFALVLAVFWGFLRRDLAGLMDRLPENLGCIAVGLVGAGALHLLLGRLPFPASDAMAEQYVQEFRAAPVPTLVLVLVLIPVVEETLFRGLVFGQLRRYGRGLAYGAGILLYAVCAVWRYALDFADWRYLLLAVLYLPMSAALTWCYDRGDSVWGAAVLHGGLNGVILMLAA